MTLLVPGALLALFLFLPALGVLLLTGRLRWALGAVLLVVVGLFLLGWRATRDPAPGVTVPVLRRVLLGWYTVADTLRISRLWA